MRSLFYYSANHWNIFCSDVGRNADFNLTSSTRFISYEFFVVRDCARLINQ